MFRVFRAKINLILGVVVLLVACGFFPPKAFSTTLTVTATYTYSATSTVDAAGNYPACSTTVTKSCVTGFNIYDVTTGTRVLIGTLSNAATPSGQQTMVQDLPMSNPSYGTHTAIATTAYKDISGTAGESSQSLSTTFIINPAAPSPPGILVKVKP